MRFSTTLLLFAFLALAKNAGAMENAARISLKSEGDGDIEIINTSEGAKLLPATSKGAAMDQPVKAEEWTTQSITFKVTKDSTVKLRLSGSRVKDGNVWVLIDNVRAREVEIINPDFETGFHKNAAPDGWKFLHNDDNRAATIRNRKIAASGETCVKVSHACPVIQRVRVSKNAVVTITFSARLAAKD